METTPDLQPLEPWNWRRLRRGFGLALLGLVIIYLCHMQRPWGQLPPGVRLTPLHTYTRADVQPGSFFDLLEQACALLEKVVVDDETRKQFDLRNQTKGAPWRDEEYPLLSQMLKDTEPALTLMQQASEQPLETSFFPESTSAYPVAYGKVQKLFNRLDLLAMRSLGVHDDAEALRALKQELRFADRCNNSHSFMPMVLSESMRALASRLAQRLAANAKEVGGLEKIASMIQEHRPTADLAEMFRHELTWFLDRAAAHPDDSLAPSEYSKWRFLAPLLGSQRSRLITNRTFYYALMIEDLEQSHGLRDPSLKVASYFQYGPVEIFLKPDPVSRMALGGDVPFFGNLYKKSGEDSSAKWSATLAVIALYRYQLEHGAWPATLAEALPVPPEDPFKNVFNYTLRHPEEEWTLTTGSDLKFASDEVAQAKAKAARKK